MTAFKGALVLIKAGDGGEPEAFTTIGGLLVSHMGLDNHVLDTTNVESGAWRQLLSASGVHAMSIQGSGLFTDSDAEETIRGYAFASTVNNYRFVFANGDYAQGAFVVTSYSRSGNYDGEEVYSLTLNSAGAISFTAS